MSSTALSEFIGSLDRFPGDISALSPWQVIAGFDSLVLAALEDLPDGLERVSDQVVVHRSAVVADSAVLTGPVLVSAGVRGITPESEPTR